MEEHPNIHDRSVNLNPVTVQVEPVSWKGLVTIMVPVFGAVMVALTWFVNVHAEGTHEGSIRSSEFYLLVDQVTAINNKVDKLLLQFANDNKEKNIDE